MSTDQTTRPQNSNDLILITVRDKKIRTVERLVNMVTSLGSYSREETVEDIPLLQSELRILPLQANTGYPSSFKAFIISEESAWFWIVANLTLSTALAVIAIPDTSLPLVYVRCFSGLLYVLFLPGYSALRAFAAKKTLQYLEQLVLSIGLSIFLTFVLGLVLNYLPWGITLGPIVLGLAIITLFFTLVATRREYRTWSQRLSSSQGSPQ